MSDTFRIVPYKVRSAGTDVPPEEVQAAINSLAQQTTIALNSVASDPTGPAGGDLGGTYPNPTVVALHVTSGTESGVAITGSTVDSTPVGSVTPSTGAFTTATAGSLFASGGAVPAVTATGTQVYNSPNPTVQFIDSIRSAGNKNAYMQWGATVLAMGFANDAFTSFTNVFTITGGFAAGVSGIASTSGTGAWAHTGGFSASGGINSTAVGATTPSTGAFTTLTASTPVAVTSGGTGRNNLTAHGVLIGEGTANINQTAAGTAGQALVSGGASADPAFGITTVIGGGTGLATLTAHSVLIGEGTGTLGQVGPNATTGLALISQGASADPVFGNPTGALINIQRITATGTYTPTAGTNSIVVELLGGGGAGGGSPATGAGQVAVGGGGNAGAYCVSRIASAFSGVTVTVGAAGTGVSGAAGNTGGNSSFGALMTANGGGGGAIGGGATTAPTISLAASAAATASGGTIANINGSFADYGESISAGLNVGGKGASSQYGAGGYLGVNGSAPTAASGFGAGGAGSAIGASSAAQAGSNGVPGVCIIYEYA